MIREISSGKDLHIAAQVIRESFRTVAEEAGATQQDWPNHPAFISVERVNLLLAEGLRLFVLFCADAPVGVVGTRRLDDDKCSLEKLAVLPNHRHQGHGKHLVEFVCNQAKAAGAKAVRLDTLDRAEVLKAWYIDLGFSIIERREFDRFPYKICIMKKQL